MNKKDLHDEFIDELCRKIPKRTDLINLVSDILRLEKESIYRRLARKVNFSIREMGILAKELNISIDRLLYKEESHQWMPVVLEVPAKLHSMDSLADIIEQNFNRVKRINEDAPGEMGNVYHTLPLEFFLHSPLMTKFMFFKWGNYFVQSEEFNHFTQWELPSRLSAIIERYTEIFNFSEVFYVWDNSLIWALSNEINNFHKMHIITTQEKEDIKNELHDILSKLEKTLNGTYVPNIPLPSETAFYVSSMNIGFTSCYYVSGSRHFALFQSNFSFSMIENSREDFGKIKEWIQSFCNISTLLSKSGRFERRLFFNAQNKIIDDILE
ncbi:hypothetical protein [Butyricimonas synergistica]|uniref:hypothetical protein n=1 Tax=Butyricimonas synergistica TaxID=544644 RepID=UPI0022E90A86|nr:hypothetical protein [Butyricimonas synergistica]